MSALYALHDIAYIEAYASPGMGAPLTLHVVDSHGCDHEIKLFVGEFPRAEALAIAITNVYADKENPYEGEDVGPRPAA